MISVERSALRAEAHGLHAMSRMIPDRFLATVFLIVLLLYHRTRGEYEDPEQLLITSLLNGSQYDRRVRPPIFDQNGKKPPLNVTVTFGLYTVIGVDETLETASIYAFVWETWNDPRLAWNPDEFGGVDIVTVQTAEIWAPDVFIFNLEMGNSDDKGSRTHATIKPVRHASGMNANVTIWYGALFQERCPLKMTYYPFDKQQCQFCMGAMASTNSQILFHSNPKILDKRHATIGGEWVLVDAVGVDNPYREYSNACLNITLQRRSIFYGINLFFPTITICLMNTVGLFSRLEEVHTQLDIATLGQTTLLSLGVILLTVAADQTPKGAIISLLGAFFITMICQTLVATFSAIYLRNRYSHQERLAMRATKMSQMGAKDLKDWKAIKLKLQALKAGFIRWERVCMFLHIAFIAIMTTALITAGILTRPPYERRV